MKLRSIKDYEGLYEIDNEGNVYSLIQTTSRRKGLIKPHEKNGYLAVNLYDESGKCKHHYIHRLVAQAFIPNPNELKYVNHIDCNKHNNSVINLEWCTQKQNIEHSIKNGLQRRRYRTFVNGIEYETMFSASIQEFNSYHKIRDLRYKLGNEFTIEGKRVKVVI